MVNGKNLIGKNCISPKCDCLKWWLAKMETSKNANWLKCLWTKLMFIWNGKQSTRQLTKMAAYQNDNWQKGAGCRIITQHCSTLKSFYNHRYILPEQYLGSLCYRALQLLSVRQIALFDKSFYNQKYLTHFWKFLSFLQSWNILRWRLLHHLDPVKKNQSNSGFKKFKRVLQNISIHSSSYSVQLILVFGQKALLHIRVGLLVLR